MRHSCKNNLSFDTSDTQNIKALSSGLHSLLKKEIKNSSNKDFFIQKDRILPVLYIFNAKSYEDKKQIVNAKTWFYISLDLFNFMKVFSQIMRNILLKLHSYIICMLYNFIIKLCYMCNILNIRLN